MDARPARLVSVFLALTAAACGAPAPGGEDAASHDATHDGSQDAGLDATSADATPSDASGDQTADDASPTDASPTDASPTDAGDLNAPRRQRCEFAAGARVADTLGFTAADRARLPIQHIIVLIQENRSFDHYLGHMNRADVDTIPAGYGNPTGSGTTVAHPTHAPTTCISPDVPHNWDAMHASWNNGTMDHFYQSATNSTVNGARALYYYTQTDLPFYYWLHGTFAMSDRFFSSVLGPTWPNRDYLYAATSKGIHNTNEALLTARTIFDQLDDAHVTWGVYRDGWLGEGCLTGWDARHVGLHNVATLRTQLMDGSLPSVVFLDGTGDGQDEHPTGDVASAERWVRTVYQAVVASPLWSSTAFFFTYDEAGGFFDHVPPPAACPPDATAAGAEFNRLGVRLPSVVVSPWARPGYVSHLVHQSTSITRFIQLVFDLPALTARDANSDAMLDMFDFSHPALMTPPAPPAGGASTPGC